MKLAASSQSLFEELEHHWILLKDMELGSLCVIQSMRIPHWQLLERSTTLLSWRVK